MIFLNTQIISKVCVKSLDPKKIPALKLIPAKLFNLRSFSTSNTRRNIDWALSFVFEEEL